MDIAEHVEEPKRRRTQAERRAETRRRLIDGAVSAINDLGLTQATTIEISRRAGVSRGALQHHFATRADMLVAVVDDVQLTLVSAFDQMPTRGSSPAEISKALVYIYWRVYNTPGYFAVIEILLGTRHDHELALKCRAMMSEMEAVREERWCELFADARLSAVEVATLRNIVTAALRGLTVRRVYWDPESRDLAEIETLARMFAGAMQGT